MRRWGGCAEEHGEGEGAFRGAKRGYRHAGREGPEGGLSDYFLISSSNLFIFSSAALPLEPLLCSLQNHQPPI